MGTSSALPGSTERQGPFYIMIQVVWLCPSLLDPFHGQHKVGIERFTHVQSARRVLGEVRTGWRQRDDFVSRTGLHALARTGPQFWVVCRQSIATGAVATRRERNAKQ